ncbi:MAG: Mur ligase family protein, partial [Bacteroidota bacterium]
TTSMIMHVLRYHQVDFDYMVGAQLEGFERMVRLSDAPLMVIEGDEYLSSPIDDRPKFLHYRPHLAVITGIAWDHINVFPTFEGYLKQFEHFAESMEPNGRLFYYQHDPHLQNLATGKTQTLKWEAYDAFEYRVEQHQTYIRDHHGQALPLKIFGAHNLQNLKAAHLICRQIGLSNEQFFSAIRDFRGAAKRLQLLVETNSAIAYQDFAHAPSKVKATIEALKAQYPDRRLLAALELHTFSSLNRHFLKEYASSMQAADQALVFFSEHTLRMKKLPMINTADIQTHFAHPNLKVIINDNQLLVEHLQQEQWLDQNLLLMSSGTFGGLDLLHLAKTCLTPN